MALQAAAVHVDITPRLYLPASGFSLVGKDACWEIWNRLFATVIFVRGDHGRAVLIGADLHVGSRLVTAEIGRRVSDLGIREEEIFFSATHTHSAPGNFYGHSYYDMLAGRVAGRNSDFVDWLSTRLATAVRGAADPGRVRACTVGYGRAPATGLVINRSLDSFKRNYTAPGKRVDVLEFASEMGHPDYAGHVPSDEGLAVDPNVHALWFEGTDGRPIGGFASFGGHATVTGPDHRTMTSDAFGIAIRHAMDAMWRSDGLRVPVALVAGSSGDTNFKTWDSKGRPVWKEKGEGEAKADYTSPQRWKEANRVGAALGDALSRALAAARACAHAAPPGGDVSVSYRDADASRGVVTRSNHRGDTIPRPLANAWWTGEGVAHGGPFWPPWKDIPPNVAVDGDHPQWPKRRQVLHKIAAPAFDVPQVNAFRVVRIGDVVLAGLPGEPTTMTAHRARKLLAAAPPGGAPASGVLVCGYTGGYVGYLPTPEEYEHQDYEGASTLWGRWTGDWVLEQLALCRAGQTTKVLDPKFTKPIGPKLRPKMKPAKPAISTLITAKRVAGGWLIEGQWCPERLTIESLSGPAVDLGWPAAVQLYRVDAAGALTPLVMLGLPVNDRTRDIRLWLEVERGMYEFEWVVPEDIAATGDELMFRVEHPGLRPRDATQHASRPVHLP